MTSLSYNRYESHYPVNYMIRRCNEFMKLALQGLTVVAASGDLGVTAAGKCMGPGFDIILPTFLSCPYITLVGTTELTLGNSPGSLRGLFQRELFQDGGFNNVFVQPGYLFPSN